MVELTAETYANLSTISVVFFAALLAFVAGAALSRIGGAIRGLFDD